MKILLITFLLALPVAAQTDTQRLAKVLDVLDKTEAVVKAQQAELDAKNAVIAAKEAQIKAQDTQIAFLTLTVKSRQEEVDALRKIKCSKTKFFWGIISTTKCQ